MVDGARIEALDTAGAWVLQKLLRRLRDEGTTVKVRDLRPEFAKLLDVGRTAEPAEQAPPPGAERPVDA